SPRQKILPRFPGCPAPLESRRSLDAGAAPCSEWLVLPRSCARPDTLRRVQVPPPHSAAKKRGPSGRVRSLRAIVLASPKIARIRGLPAFLFLLAQILVAPARRR